MVLRPTGLYLSMQPRTSKVELSLTTSSYPPNAFLIFGAFPSLSLYVMTASNFKSDMCSVLRNHRLFCVIFVLEFLQGPLLGIMFLPYGLRELRFYLPCADCAPICVIIGSFVLSLCVVFSSRISFRDYAFVFFSALCYSLRFCLYYHRVLLF